MDEITYEEAKKWADLCSICGKPIRYWHDYLTEGDDIIQTSWHRRCAKDYQTWLYKVTHILPSYERQPDIPRNARWDTFFESYQRRILGAVANKKE